MDALSVGRTVDHVAVFVMRVPDALHPPHHANDLALEPEWDIQVATVGVSPLAPTIPITSCAGNNPAFISAWPISQAFSFG